MSRTRLAGGIAAVVAVLSVLALATRGTSAPVFSRGGVFVDPAVTTPSPSASATIATAARPVSRGDTVRGVQTSAAARPHATSAPHVASTRLALGTYNFAVAGWESVTGFGRRDFPPTMTLRAQHSSDTKPDEAVFDLTYSSQHEEREVVAYHPDSVALTYEAGSVTFGPYTQTSEASYDPAMTQIPLPLAVGAKRSGTAKAVAPNGSVTRTEDWTVRVLRKERIEIAGASIPTYVVQVHRQTRAGSSEQVTRDRTYWYDPGRSLWVKWHETMHAERNYGIHFTYDDDYTATLTSYKP